ncbi:MAG: dipicolinate synthase subunit DpsA [Clostridia bacterium]
MMKKIKIAIFGGDKRQEYLAQMLSEKFDIQTFAVYENNMNLEDLHKKFDVYIFPLPISKDNIHLNTKFEEKQIKLLEIMKKIPPRSLILGGNVTESVKSLFSTNGLEIIDYWQREQLAILNAVPIALSENLFTLRKYH